MLSKKFKLTTLTDIVLIASANTEGNISYLDYIPGSAIRGVAAIKWNEYSQPFEMFYTDSVRFCDARPLVQNRIFYKIPLSFHKPKLKETPIMNDFFIEEEDRKKFKQFKQLRSGYFNAEYNTLSLTLQYRQKSARDYNHGRSAEGKMFGYASIPPHTTFGFEIKAVNQQHLEELEKNIVGIQRIGKSKSAEYGLVKIEPEEWEEGFEHGTGAQEVVYLYAKSRLILTDESGNPTYDLSCLHPTLSTDNVDYTRSYIRTGVFAPYNRTRKMRDAQRPFIEKGSVIALKNVDEKTLNAMKNGVGVYKNEGFGEILINPSFLQKKVIELNSLQTKEAQNPTDSSALYAYLQKRAQKRSQDAQMLQAVDLFLKEKRKYFTNISPSQWGTVRALAKRYKENAEDFIKEFISEGIKAWREDQQKVLLKFIHDNGYKATIILATEMAKEAK